MCECGHQLGVHIPDPNRPFDWPCHLCPCREYKERINRMIYILYVAWNERTMRYVRVSRGEDGRWRVYEGLTNA